MRCEDLAVANAKADSVKKNDDNEMTHVIWHAEVKITKNKTTFLSIFNAEENVKKKSQR